MAHRGRLLEGDADAAASPAACWKVMLTPLPANSELNGLVVEKVALQAVAGGRRGLRWAQEHG